MERSKRVGRPAAEQAVDLLKESSDWLPPLKAAAGGVAFIMKQIRLREDNASACDQLLRRIIKIDNNLYNYNRTDFAPNITEMVHMLESNLLKLSQTLQRFREGGLLSAHLRVGRDKQALDGCWMELNAAVDDTQLSVTLLQAAHSYARHADLYNTIAVRALSGEKNSRVMVQVGPRGFRCALLRDERGDRIYIEADASLVLFA
ncbi:hypothetical protein BKA62DRAFT_720233 [Auriculariales sp. MPI-PUGE-AT-0066]|nr:hypothetical protein BKA62DRAFT_720233 [Auriculariales sp. MPI-PUGE-AT-0066]